MYNVVKVFGDYREIIDNKGKPNRYGDPKLFKTRAEAQKWIDRKSYVGMSYSYEIKRGE